MHTREDLLNEAKALGVKVYDGKTSPWVDDLCKNMGTEAFVYTPNSKRYPNEPPTSEKPAETSNDKLFEHFEKVADGLEKTAQQALFCKANTPKDVLMHELFHVLQQKNGLPFGVDSKTDEQFGDLLDELKSPTLAARFKHLVLGAIGFVHVSPTEPKNEVYKAMYRHYQRECEVDQFMLYAANHNAKASTNLGLNTFRQLKHLAHYLLNSLPNKNITTVLDTLRDRTH